MQRNDFYPHRKGDKPEWHINFAGKFQQYGPGLNFLAAQINNAVADNLMLAYALGGWHTNVKEFAPACTASIQLLESGEGEDLFVFPDYVVPALPTLPAGILGVKPGALDRTFLLVHEIKAKPGFNLAMGLDMGIVGSEAATPPPGDPTPPRIKVTVVQGVGNEYGRVKFFKDGHTGLWLESRRGNGPWEFLTTTDKSPFIDNRPLLVPGQAEVREYRARFWDAGQPNGPWCDVAKVTISP